MEQKTARKGLGATQRQIGNISSAKAVYHRGFPSIMSLLGTPGR